MKEVKLKTNMIDDQTSPLSDAQLQSHLYDTLDRLGAWLPDMDVTFILDELQTEYEVWQEEGKFDSSSGFWAEEFKSEGSELRIPPELGFDLSKRVYRIHFVPDYFYIDEKNEGQLRVEQINKPKQDQKNLTMTAGLAGALEFITLVEAGLVPKPDYLFGSTNPAMAKFAHHTGLKTAARVASDMARDKSLEIDVDAPEFREMERNIDGIYAKLFSKEVTEEEARRATLHVLEVAAHAKRMGEMSLYEGAIRLANCFMTNTLMDTTTIVWGSYEDFRDRVLRFNKQFGEKLLRLADKEAAPLLALSEEPQD